MDEEEVKDTQQTKQSGNVVDTVAQTAQQGKKMVDNVKNVKKAANAAKTLSMSGPLMYILFWVFVVIVAIIIITGIVMFLVTMPGMVMEKLKGIFKEIGNYIAAFYGADTTQQIDDVQIYETLDYIEDMGWDIKAEGFLTGYYKDGDDVEGKDEGKLSAEEVEAGYEIDEKTGVVRAEGGKIILAKSDFIFTYIMSDNYVYTLKNDNLATQENADGWFEELTTAIVTSWYKVRNYVFGPFFDAIGVTNGMMDKFGKGLIGLYYDNGLGKEGDAVNQNTFWNWDKIKIDPKKKTLYVKRSSLFDINNNAMEYSLDGWTGRYGMPLEFLLSVHKATMMPDLAYDMVTTFPTEVHLLLHKASGEAIAGYKTPDGNYIMYPAIEQTIVGFKADNWFKKLIKNFSYWIDSDAAKVQAAKNCGVDVGHGEDGCTCTLEEAVGDENGFRVEKSWGKWKYVYNCYLPNADGVMELVHKEGEICNNPDEDNPIWVVEEACERCTGIVDGIMTYLGDNNDYKFITYIPYISKVTDHWYRDVYFVLTGDDDTKLVDYDYDYEAVMKERWTLYETYPDDSSDPIYGTTTDAEYKEEKVGEFIIYLIDEDGEYRKDGSDRYMIYDGTFDEARGDTLYIKNEKDEYVMYTGVVDENGQAKDKNGNLISLYRKVSDEEFVPYDKNETIAVAKKAVTIDSSDTDALEDVGWMKNSDDVWSAYDEKSTSSSYEPLFENAEIEKEENEYYKLVMQNSYINLNLTNNIIQVGEGQRAETNPHIKKMFLNNKYFRYDGSEETAEIITALRTRNTDDKDDDIKYGALSDVDLQKTIEYPVGSGKTYKAEDYAGTVVLNQDSLNAFSMLENTHTLDSDYIYRDFKELIVELGYFEKEELTDETPRLLAFPVAIGSAGYPDRTIDKRENEFGTMVHSKHDIDANKKYTLKAVIDNVKKEKEGGAAEPSSGAGAGGGTSKPMPNAHAAIEDRFSKSVTLASSRVNNNRLQLTSNPVNITEVGAISGVSKKPEQVPLQTFLKETEKMCKFIDKVGYNYCVSRIPGKGRGEGTACECNEACINAWSTNLECSRFVGGDCPCTEVHCHHTVHRRTECGLSGSFEASQESPTSHYDTCCNYLVRWAFQNVGITDIDKHYAISSMYDWFLDELNGKEIQPGEPLKPGDILFYDDFGHVDGILEGSGSSFIKFNGGHAIEKGATKGSGDSSMNQFNGWNDGRVPEHVVRLNWGNQNEGDYEGFIGNEAVVSPVSGILLDYGTYDENDIDSVSELEYRVNVDLRYGPSISIAKEDTNTQQQGQGQQQSKNPTTEVEHESRIFSDKVGYARILVLNKEIFEMLDTSVSHRWRTNNDSQGLLSNNGVFAELMTTEEQLEELTDADTGDFVSETVYGYKEFTELYERYGIAGYVLYIDGFKCELPDSRVFDSDEDKDLSDESLTPDGEDLSIDDFKIYSGSIKNDNEKIQNLYEIPETPYKLASEKATVKLNVEETIKGDAYGVITIDNPKTYEPLKDLDELIFIKEGTVLGRTFTNKELVEQRLADGDDSKYDYKYYAPDEDPNASAEDKKKNWDRLLGNYVRVIMRDENMEEIESVEDYMKLDESKQGDQEYQFREGDLEILADAIQHEGGGCGGWAKEIGATTDEDKLYLSISTGYTIINKLNTDSGFTPDYNDPSKLWDPSQSPLYNLLCRIPDGEKYQQLAQQYGFTTGLNGGWYAIAPGLRHRIETDTLEYCDICLEAAEYIKEHDSKHHTNNGRFGADFLAGESMPHTLWQQGAGYDGKSRIWVYADKNKNGVKDTVSSDSGDFYLFDTAD